MVSALTLDSIAEFSTMPRVSGHYTLYETPQGTFVYAPHENSRLATYVLEGNRLIEIGRVTVDDDHREVVYRGSFTADHLNQIRRDAKEWNLRL